MTQNQEQEVAGGLRNALERGETLAKAKQSFLNAGYKPEEVESAARKMPTINPITNKLTAVPVISQAPNSQVTQSGVRPLPIMNIPGQQKHLSKKFIIILAISAVLAITIAGILGIYWNRIF